MVLPFVAGALLGGAVNLYEGRQNRKAAEHQANQANAGFNMQSPYLADLYAQAQQQYRNGGTPVPNLDRSHYQAQQYGFNTAGMIPGRLNPAYDAVNRAMNPYSDPTLQTAQGAFGGALGSLQGVQQFGAANAGAQYAAGQPGLQQLMAGGNTAGLQGYQNALPGAMNTLGRAQAGYGDPRAEGTLDAMMRSGVRAQRYDPVGQYGQALPGAVNTLDQIQGGMGRTQAGSTLSQLQGGAGRSEQYLNALNPTLGSFLSGRANTAVYDPIMQNMRKNAFANLRENVIPGINDSFLRTGSFGGGRYQKALGIAAGKTNEALIGAESNFAAQAAQAAMDNQRYGAGLVSQLSGQQASQAAQSAGMAEQMRQANTQERLNAAGQIGSMFAGFYNPAQSMALNAAGQAEQGRANRMGEGLQAAGQIGSMYGNLNSQAQNAQLGALGLNENIRQNLVNQTMGSGQYITNLYNSMSNASRGHALQGASMVPGLNAAALAPMDVYNQIGDQNRGVAIDRANAPAQALGQYASIMQGNYQSPRMGATPTYSSPLSSALGGGMAASQMWDLYNRNKGGGGDVYPSYIPMPQMYGAGGGL